jgi:N,N'-diacetylchitobiose phosphorylase
MCPLSWTNYVGTERMGGGVQPHGGRLLLAGSPEYHRVTRFRPNGVPMDRPGHYAYLRDAETGKYWSVSWQPVGVPLDEAVYACRHGLSYSKYLCEYEGISASQTVFIPRGDEVVLWDVKI